MFSIICCWRGLNVSGKHAIIREQYIIFQNPLPSRSQNVILRFIIFWFDDNEFVSGCVCVCICVSIGVVLSSCRIIVLKNSLEQKIYSSLVESPRLPVFLWIKPMYHLPEIHPSGSSMFQMDAIVT